MRDEKKTLEIADLFQNAVRIIGGVGPEFGDRMSTAFIDKKPIEAYNKMTSQKWAHRIQNSFSSIQM